MLDDNNVDDDGGDDAQSRKHFGVFGTHSQPTCPHVVREGMTTKLSGMMDMAH